MNREEFLHRLTIDGQSELISGPVLVALSGGADSVALLRALLETGHSCRAVHCNFHLRSDESMRDEHFVRQLCEKLNVPLTVKDFDVQTWQQEHGGSVEMACRELRYDWFEQERQQQGCAVIAVAHHADDQIETFFLNLLRGTGLKGLTGMGTLNGHIWRPLLGLSRDDILDYLESLGQDYVTDSTNSQNDYRRNRLRNLILPLIGQQFPQASQRILDTMDNLASDNRLLTAMVKVFLPDECHIDIKRLESCPQASTLLYHRIRHLGFNRDQCQQAMSAALQHHIGRQFMSNSHTLVVNRHKLDIAAIEEVEEEIEIPVDLTKGLNSPVRITATRGDLPFSPLLCDGKRKVAFSNQLLDCKRVVLRHWQRGDRMKPYGMNGSKLLSDLFADLKLEHQTKQNAWILEADGQILWVLGYRASSLYSVTPESQQYLLLTFS